ncbi:MAG: maleylacetoacetate isomerase [Polynucleobacter sp.]|jgi:maleylacetoacetate isomerase/maleylpyruvate isomerase|nr:maleylacetoacetate isomerase [Polynucleobacter sp.]
MKSQLYSFWRSSAAFRVRIALNLKQLDYQVLPLHLIKQGGEHLQAEYQKLNPGSLVPLYIEDQTHLHQSLAIIEYLEERYPNPALLPTDLLDRAWVRAISLDIACDIHPINNLRVLRYLVKQLGISNEAKDEWYRHWVKLGLESLEKRIEQDKKSGDFCLGNQPTIADIVLVPQLFNAANSEMNLSAYPNLKRITQNCMQIPAFINASWEHQIDTEGKNPSLE